MCKMQYNFIDWDTFWVFVTCIYMYMHVEYSVICLSTFFVGTLEILALPILAILHMILVLAHVLKLTLHITWQFMQKDGENSSLFASCALMKHSSYSELLLSLFSVFFFCNFAYRALNRLYTDKCWCGNKLC